MKGALVDLSVKLGCFTAKVKGTIEWLSGPPMPGSLSLVVFSQKENGMLQFKLSPLPPGSAIDVVTQEVTVTIADGAPLGPFVVPVTQTELLDPAFEGPEDAPVVTSLVDIDGKGNRSPAHVQTLVLVDNQAPPEPGDIGLVVTGQT